MSESRIVHVRGPLASYAAGFEEDLAAQGHRGGSICDHLYVMAQLSRWLVSEDLAPADLSGSAVEKFACWRAARGYVTGLSPKRMGRLVDYLAGVGAVTGFKPAVEATPLGELLERYGRYLADERGLSTPSVRVYDGVARGFLAYVSAGGELDLTGLSAAEVTGFVLRECSRCTTGSAKAMTTRLRSLLRFFYVAGLTPRDLRGAVPSVASWRQASLPKAIDARDVTGLLRACDRRRATGRRDFAVLTVLSRLGLRAGEVAGLRLESIDWRCGEVVVRGKRNREDRLPLPADVGEAIVGWLQRGRPRCADRHLFTRVRAPLEGLSAGGVSAIVRRACERAGLPAAGSHRLRHTAATEMLRAGANLAEVGQVLRHRSADTTAIYAKVDRRSLSAVVQPWPGGAR